MSSSYKAEVLICGSGSAGLCTATWLSRYGIPCTVLERRAGPMTMGQADGVQCRTVEIFESFGIGTELLEEGYHVVEVVFWGDGDGDGDGGAATTPIIRMGRTADTQPGLSHQPHIILNQARINALFIETMQRFSSNQGTIEYGVDVKGIDINEALVSDPAAYPITVTAERDGRVETYQAKYVLACDGAHSTIRKSLSIPMIGDSSDAIWGVMDMIPRTNFPDIRKKATIRTSNRGNVLIIPREETIHQSLTRFYIELPPGTRARDVQLEDLQQTAKKIFYPYEIDFVETVWWSAYAIGQRYADLFHRDFRVFLAGDACHTHSPKAGQGMNVSLQDGYNIGWKLAGILSGVMKPEVLQTYVHERRKVAIDLINFDRYFSKLFSSSAGRDSHRDAATATATATTDFQDEFVKSGKFTAGLTSRYEKSLLTMTDPITSIRTDLQCNLNLATNITVGMRLPSAQVVRFCDSKPVQLLGTLGSTGQWRIIVFSGDLTNPINLGKLNKIGIYLESSSSPIHRFTPKSAYIDSLIEPVLVCHGSRHAVELDQIPKAFYPVTGKYQVRDLRKIYFDDESYNKGHGHAYDFLGVDTKEGAIVIVRPDQYVSAVLRLNDYEKIGTFFERFLVPRVDDQLLESEPARTTLESGNSR